MAALRYRDQHNKVGYLQKPTGSDDYHQILDTNFSPGRLSLVPTGKVLSPGSDNDSNDASVHSEAILRRMRLEEIVMEGSLLPPTTADEHIVVQRESKVRTTLLQSIPDDHVADFDYVADFHYMDDARDIWNAVKARFGGNAESKKLERERIEKRERER
ncbi:hypothetical protein Tco_0824271 [Tanacetum coccineum]|uniref:Xylulose kinase-1 n=1 Tax=Tanacetum coccineum TaxID=301880 RepID=A0ABQ5ANM8_9ASTR